MKTEAIAVITDVGASGCSVGGRIPLALPRIYKVRDYSVVVKIQVSPPRNTALLLKDSDATEVLATFLLTTTPQSQMLRLCGVRRDMGKYLEQKGIHREPLRQAS